MQALQIDLIDSGPRGRQWAEFDDNGSRTKLSNRIAKKSLTAAILKGLLNRRPRSAGFI
jgi:hypothetical protein